MEGERTGKRKEGIGREGKGEGRGVEGRERWRWERKE